MVLAKSEGGIHFDYGKMRKSRLLRASFYIMCLNTVTKIKFSTAVYSPPPGLKHWGTSSKK